MGSINSSLPRSHGDKLKALLNNSKLPKDDIPMVKQAIEKYDIWLEEMKKVTGTYEEKLAKLVSLFNEYKFFIDFDLIFNNENSFLYRQKGQLKLDNTIIEEFLPYLVTTVFSEEFAGKNLTFGPATCFSSLHFESNLLSNEPGAGMTMHQKDQDFVISKKVFIKASLNNNFDDSIQKETHVAYLATECKTNLDKTMFQEASATALDLKTSVPFAKYFLLCDWLDMTPINSGTTAINEIIILRKAKRLSSNIRSQFDTYEGRKKNSDFYQKYLKDHPFAYDSFNRFLSNIKDLITTSPEEKVLEQGYF